jgi:hypothetical protein
VHRSLGGYLVTTLSNHIPNSSARSKPERKEYWQALYYSGILSVFPIAVINMAIYFAIAEGEEMEFYWKGTGRKLEAYNYLPIQLRVLDSRGCTEYSTI